MINYGQIDINKYKKISDNKIASNELILTDNRRDHIIERRGLEFFNNFCDIFYEIACDPDYIFKDKSDESTAIASKKIETNGHHINLVIKIAIGENVNYKNSIITVIAENEKRFNQRLRNNIVIYEKTFDND